MIPKNANWKMTLFVPLLNPHPAFRVCLRKLSYPGPDIRLPNQGYTDKTAYF
jgi:hypothetical protein